MSGSGRFQSSRYHCESIDTFIDYFHPISPATISFFPFQEEDCKTYTLLQGYFKSPLAIHLPGLVPKVSENAHFEILLPKQWKWANNLKPMVVQYAGTGDHVRS